MFSLWKKISPLLIAMFIIGSLAIPHICTDNHTEQKISISDNASVNHSHSEKTAKADNSCCVAHHCCAGKIMNTVDHVSSVIITTTLVSFTSPDQVISGLKEEGLERPPKSIA